MITVLSRGLLGNCKPLLFADNMFVPYRIKRRIPVGILRKNYHNCAKNGKTILRRSVIMRPKR